MKTQNNLVKSDSTSEISIYRQQLNEALSLIRILQRSNADLMKQNANVMQMNNRLLKRMPGGITGNPEDHFLARVLSIIGDNNIVQEENNTSGNENYPEGNENYQPFNDNNTSFADNNPLRNDNGNTFADKNNPRADNNHGRNEKSHERKENNHPVNENGNSCGDNVHPLNDNCKEINDNGTIYLEICGRRHDKNKLLESLRYRINICQHNNYSDDELIEFAINHFKQYAEKEVEQKKSKHENKLRNVPALFHVEAGHKTLERLMHENEFYNLVTRYRSLKKRGGKNYRPFAKQVKMLVLLYKHEYIKPGHLFSLSGISSVTGNRYVAIFKKRGFLESTGTIDCNYKITERGINFLENKNS